MSRRAPLVLGLLLCAGLAAYTSSKLHTMARIRGFIGERTLTPRVVVDKSEGGDAACYLWWDQADLPSWRTSDLDIPIAPGPVIDAREVQADCDYWERVRVGDLMVLVTVGDGEVYLKDGEIYASDGNFAFDFALLAAELAGVIACIVLLVRVSRRARYRRPLPSARALPADRRA